MSHDYISPMGYIHIMQDKQSWVSGQWNAYVAAGHSREDRLTRLAEVPEQWKDRVKSHVETVFRLAKSKKQK